MDAGLWFVLLGLGVAVAGGVIYRERLARRLFSASAKSREGEGGSHRTLRAPDRAAFHGAGITASILFVPFAVLVSYVLGRLVSPTISLTLLAAAVALAVLALIAFGIGTLRSSSDSSSATDRLTALLTLAASLAQITWSIQLAVEVIGVSGSGIYEDLARLFIGGPMLLLSLLVAILEWHVIRLLWRR